MEKIALLPGGFKPPHAGHYNMAVWLAQNTDAEKVIVKVGAKERDGITREISLQLWDLFLKNDPNSNSQKITVVASNSNSPVQDVYDFVENEAPEESTIYLGMGEKDINDARFKNIPKFAEPRGIKFETTLVPPQAGGVSGTKMREFIKNNDKKSFQQYIPEFLTDEQKDRAWELVSSLNEDFYDPRNKFYDFAKSNDPGPKDDIEPSYKYKRGGIYGKMYEIEQEIEELMYGTMNNQEKAKHAKNLKRLKKDISKQGDQYMEVPDYLKGTLKRKMYERDLSDKEEKIAQELPDKEFKKRYGKDWKSVKIATATKMAKKENYPPYKADQVQKVRYQASDTFTNSPKDAKKKGYLEGDTYEKMAAKGKKKGNLKQGTVRKRLKIKDGEKIPLSKITKAISKIKKMKNPSEKNKKYLKALNLAKTLKTTTHKENINEADPKKGTGKKPKGSGRRLYTDENPKDTVKVKFSTRQDIVDTLNKKSFKSKSHARQSQVINLIHQRVRAALNRAKDPDVKKRLKTAFDYIKKRKEASKKKTQRMKKEGVFTKDWWKEQITEVLTETKANTHLTHLEELVLTQGQDGYNQAKAFLYELIKNLKGEDNTIKNVSVKWDGAPAIFTGINPDNGKFFVGTKSVFNVNPKINYTSQDIDENHGHAAGLAKKLKLALQYLPAVGIKGILQGDFMFDSDDVETEDIDGVTHYTFKPNTIRYAVEANSELGKQIIAANIGIIFHTTYNDLSGGGASFGADISGLSKTPSVWFDDAYFKDTTGILLSDEEEKFVLDKIETAESIEVDYNSLPTEISSNAKTNLLNTYLNQEIRKGEFITDPNKSFEMFKEWYQSKIEKAVAKISPKNQDKKRKQLEDKLKTFESKKDIVINLFKVSKLLSQAKNIFIAKYDKAVATKHFIDNGDGTLRVTKAEGFVAVDHTESGIKLVDRLEFSKNNFNAGKPGAKK